MQPETRDPACIADMLAAARGIVRTLAGVPLSRYQADEDLRHAVERKLEIMGEAARRVSDSLRDRHPEIPWRAVIGQRNVLIHGYDEIDDARVWRLAAEHIPQVIAQLEAIANRLTTQRED
jgi:uncharacterized protein with HEPN domain